MFMHVLAASILCIRIIISCDVHVCLTWEAENEKITFKCRVSRLKWRLYFYNPDNKEEGHCLNPIPFPLCYSSNNNVISQDLRTNTTVLLIHGHVKKKLIGTWKCVHGTERDKAFVNVSVINTDHCVEEHLAWTFIGGMICVTILLIIRIAVNINKDKLESFLEERECRRDDFCWKNFCVFHSNVRFGLSKLFIGITLFSLGIIIPLYIGLLQKNCKDKYFFLIYGFWVVLMFVLCNLLPRKRNRLGKQPEQSERSSLNIDPNSQETDDKD
ncbi:uncharacterized protein LOC127736820 isoform X1 [Mytilus californianus]|uniref:uncharacterized protein LOC127736820 isoform X1 n=1 Tax=Mytilus californianus TaxID=6549 RepID=UPI002246037C|nr:uncharacterized protein LOC127736820 isoform X1 [Mytilus californianus]